ncbi:hypothetical protein P5673_027019, partial [Acropora cervicornis]
MQRQTQPSITNDIHTLRPEITSTRSQEELVTLWFGIVIWILGRKMLGKECFIVCAANTLGLKLPVEEESIRKPLAKSSKAMAALRKIVLDPKWLSNLHFYVRFRHTAELENFNSMMTKYAPKRIAFEYPYFIMRIHLAAIDHNF